MRIEKKYELLSKRVETKEEFSDRVYYDCKHKKVLVYRSKTERLHPDIPPELIVDQNIAFAYMKKLKENEPT